MGLRAWFAGRLDLLRRVSQLEERQESLERDQKNLELEWSEVFGRVRRSLAALNKRTRKGEEEPEEVAEDISPAMLLARARQQYGRR